MPYPVQVANLRRKLIERFRPLNITEDVAARPDEEQMFLSRAVAALAVTMVTGGTDEEAARAITDGSGDEGIDAVAVEGREIIVVQAKWNDRGNAGFGHHDVSAVVDGLHYLFNRDFERLGPKMAPHVTDLTRALAAQRPRAIVKSCGLRDGCVSRSSLVETEAEGVAGGVEEHSDVLLRLVLGHRGAQGDRRVQIADLEVEVHHRALSAIDRWPDRSPVAFGLLEYEEWPLW